MVTTYNSRPAAGRNHTPVAADGRQTQLRPRHRKLTRAWPGRPGHPPGHPSKPGANVPFFHIFLFFFCLFFSSFDYPLVFACLYFLVPRAFRPRVAPSLVRARPACPVASAASSGKEPHPDADFSLAVSSAPALCFTPYSVFLSALRRLRCNPIQLAGRIGPHTQQNDTREQESNATVIITVQYSVHYCIVCPYFCASVSSLALVPSPCFSLVKVLM